MNDDNNYATNLLPPLKEWKHTAPYQEASPAIEHTDDGIFIQRSNGHRNCNGRLISMPVTIQEGIYYDINIICLPENIRNERVNLHTMMSWYSQDGNLLQRDYIPCYRNGEYLEFSRILPAPAYAVSVAGELCFKWSETGRAVWQRAFMRQTTPPDRRIVRAASAFARGKGNMKGNLENILNLIDMTAVEKPDIVCLNEAALSYGISALEAAVTLDGQEVAAICGKAKQHNMYIVAGLYIIEDGVYYNTSVLIGRTGMVEGCYRKIHLPLSEVEDGFTPGDEPCVLDTDFGKIGLMICWDMAFPETAGMLRDKNAEIIFVSSMWCPDIQARARAVDNGMFLVLSSPFSNPVPCQIIDPNGNITASVKGLEKGLNGKNDIIAENGFCVCDIDLNKQYTQYWFSIGPANGEVGPILRQERRSDIYK